MKINKWTRFAFLLAFVIQSCRYKSEPCMRYSFLIGIQGLDMLNTENAKVIYFTPDKQFKTPIDSTRHGLIPTFYNGAVVFVDYLENKYRVPQGGCDVEIRLPGLNKAYRLTDIVWENKSQKCRVNFGVRECKNDPCFNLARSCVHNGKTFQMQHYYDDYQVVYIPK